MTVNWNNKIKYRNASSGDTLFKINLLYCKLIKIVEITSLTQWQCYQLVYQYYKQTWQIYSNLNS